MRVCVCVRCVVVVGVRVGVVFGGVVVDGVAAGWCWLLVALVGHVLL